MRIRLLADWTASCVFLAFSTATAAPIDVVSDVSELPTLETITPLPPLGRPSGRQEVIAPVGATSPANHSVERSAGGVAWSADRLAASYRTRKVTRVTRPVDAADLFSWQLGVSGAFDGSQLAGLFALGYRRLDPVGSFPTGEGGSRFGFSLELLLQGLAGQIEVPDTGGDFGSFDEDQTTDETLFIGNGLIVPALSWLSFGPLDRETLAQEGWGFKLGLGIGYGVTYYADDSSSSVVVSPQFGLEFVDFNPGTGEFSSFTILALILPLDPVLGSLTMGGSF